MTEQMDELRRPLRYAFGAFHFGFYASRLGDIVALPTARHHPLVLVSFGRMVRRCFGFPLDCIIQGIDN